MISFLEYGFAIRALEVGVIVGAIAPIIGIFLVLRRYSLIADTLAHISFAGLTIGFLLKINPLVSALIVTLISSLGIEKLRSTKKIFGETALALFLSGSLALSTVLLSLGNGFSSNIFSYLFGSILTVTQTDVYMILTVAIVVLVILILFFKELVSITFDEDFARVSGIPVERINKIFTILAAVTIALSIPVVGTLLISALIVIPAITALEMKTSFIKTIFWAECISIFSVILGIFASFYLNLATGGTIVLVMIAMLAIVMVYKRLL